VFTHHGLTIRSAGLVVVAALAGGCVLLPSPGGTPVIGFQIEGEGRQPTLKAYLCESPKTAPYVFRLSVYKRSPEPVPGDAKTVCLLDGGGQSKELPAPWRYGTEASGFRLVKCDALEPGGRYTVEGLGTGAGVQGFQIGPDGKVAVTPGPCGKTD
jgi:hypothetical protein